MTKEALKDIIDQLRFLNSRELELYEIGVQISTITSKWYKVATLLLNEIYNIGQVDFIICYVYDDLNKYEQFNDIDTYDKFYDYLINLKEENNGQETSSEEITSEETSK
jgi:transcription elongation factor Elf1